MERRLSFGRETRGCTISAFCRVGTRAAPVTLTIRTRLPVRPLARSATVPSCGRKPAMCAILGRCREIRRVRLAQSIIMGLLLDIRKVHAECGVFCGLQELECRV